MKIESIKFFARFLKKYIAHEALLLILMLLGSVAALASPFVLKIIIDDVFPSGSFTLLLQVLAVYFGICILRLVITYATTYLFEWVSNHLMKDMRLSLFSHLIRLPLGFFDKEKTGDVIHRVNSEVNSIQNILTGTVIRIINSLCTLLGLTVMLCILNLKLFLISLTVFPFIYINTRYYQPKIHQNIKRGRLKDSEILSYLMERFRNIKLLKSYMSYGYEEKKLHGLIDEQIDINIKNVRLSSMTRTISMLLSLLVPIVILLIGGMDVMAGAMSIGALVAFIQYTNRLFEPMRDLMGLYFDMVRAGVSMDRVYEVILLSTEKSGKVESVLEKVVGGDLELSGVHFSYDNTPVLKDINIIFRQGKKYALIGESGCGKSTIINLLCKFYAPDRGTIKLSGRDSGTFDLETWRSNLNLVTQDNHLFHDTIKSNIIYAKENATNNELITACAWSKIDTHISKMENGYESIIGDQGVTLSGGQRQRIAIARSVLKSGGIILLDEATSAIDSETEKEIIENLFRVNTGKTIILVSHRLSAIRNVDEIICIREGRIAETGSHDQLMEKKGYYWRLYNEQVR